MTKLPQIAKKCILDDVLKYEQPTKYIVKSTNYDDSYNTPVLTAGKSFIIGYTNETEGICKDLPVIIFDDFTTSSQYVDFPFKVKSSAMKILHATKEANIKYLFYLMQIIQHKADTHKRYWISEYSQRQIELPSKLEQDRIVEKIEEEFGKIDEGVEKLKLAQEQIKQYRQSVLTKFYDIKDDIHTNLGSCFEIVNGDRGKNYPAKNKLHKEGIPFVSAINISNGKLREDNLCCLSDEQYNLLGNGKINKGDTLLCIRGSIGKHCRYFKEKGAIASSMVIIRKSDMDIQNEYLHYYIDSPYFYNEVKKYDNGTAQPNLSAADLKKFLYPNIEIDEQKQIVKEIEKRFEVTDEVERVITENLEKAEQLKQSILKKAFEGRLVPQDPTGESALVLLEKIKAERNK